MKEDKYEEDHWSGSSISAFSSIKESFDGSSAMYRILCSGKANLMTSQKHKDISKTTAYLEMSMCDAHHACVEYVCR